MKNHYKKLLASVLLISLFLTTSNIQVFATEALDTISENELISENTVSDDSSDVININAIEIDENDSQSVSDIVLSNSSSSEDDIKSAINESIIEESAGNETTKIVQISLGYTHSGAIDEDGNLWMWGSNLYGQLGDGTTTGSPVPKIIEKDTKFKSLSLGYQHSGAIDEDGNLWMWGYNNFGQIGDDSQTNRLKPKIIKQGTKFKSLSLGHHHSGAIDEDGNLWMWGDNASCQIGDGTQSGNLVPKIIPDEPENTKFTALSMGEYHSGAIDKDGNLWMWGWNKYYQIGDGNYYVKYVPKIIPDEPENTKFVSFDLGYCHSGAIDEDGHIWTWGRNWYGELGDGTQSNNRIPTRIPNDTKFTSLSFGEYHSGAIDEDGNLWVWGFNGNGRLGDGTTEDRHLPKKIMKNTTIKTLCLGSTRSGAIDKDGNLWMWGAGPLGDGSSEGSDDPQKIEFKKKKAINNFYSGDFYFDATSGFDGAAKGTATYSFSADLNDFFTSSYTYQHSLTQLSIRAAMAAMGDKKTVNKTISYPNENIVDPDFLFLGNDTFGAYNILRFMDQLQFENFDVHYVEPTPDNPNTIGYMIGSRDLISSETSEKAKLLLVAIRGGGYNNEWGSNVTVGNETEHTGFKMAANQVIDGIKDYIQTNDLSGQENELKVWVVGFSRAAATANIVSAYLDNNAIPGLVRSNIFGYCFECPRTTTNTNASDYKYDNIINVVNPLDVVPRVPMNNSTAITAEGVVYNNKNWKFTRYGKTLLNPTRFNSKGYDSLYNDLKNSFSQIQDNNSVYTNPDASYYLKELNLQEVLNSRLNYLLSSTIDSPVKYVGFYQDAFISLIQEIMLKEDYNYDLDIINDIIRPFIGIGAENTEDKAKVLNALANLTTITATYLLAGNFESPKQLLKAHYPERTISWIDSLSANNGYLLTKKKSYSLIDIGLSEGQIDADIYNNQLNSSYGDPFVQGQTIAEATPSFENNTDLLNYTDENGQNILVVPGDSTSTFYITAKSNANFSLINKGFVQDSEIPEYVKGYTDIKLDAGDTLTVTISDNISVKDENNIPVEPTISESGNTVKMWLVSPSIIGNGVVTGGNYYNTGDSVNLIATPDDGWTFVGWYENEKNISTDAEYAFYVTEDKNLTVKFEKNNSGGDNPIDPVNPLPKGDDEIEKGDLPNGKSAPEGIWVGGLKKSYPFTGYAIKPSIRVYKGNKRLTANTDYTLSFKNNKNVGTNATITVKLKGDYSGSKPVTFAIEKNPLANVSYEEDQLTVSYKKNKKHNNIKPVLTMNGVNLKYSAKDFDFKYLDAKTKQDSTCIDVGEYIVRMTAKSTSKGYSESIDVPFIVTDKPVMGAVKITAPKTSLPYNGTKQIPAFTLKYNGQPLSSSAYTMLTVSSDSYIEPGSHSVLFKGNGTDVIGSRKVTYKITGKRSLGDTNVTAILMPSSLDSEGKAPYSNGGAKPKVIISYNGTRLKENIDYTLSYKHNKKVNQTGTVTVKGKGNYKGSKPLTFTVSQRDLNTLILTVNDRAASNKTDDYKKAPILFTDKNYTDQKLKANTDYTATFTVSSGSSKPVAGDVVTVMIEAKSDGKVKGNATTTFKIIEKSKDISRAKVKINGNKALPYTGKAVQPSKDLISITLDGKPVSTSDYDIVTYYNNINRGNNAIVMINGKGNLSGAKAVKFKIGSSSIDKIWDGAIVFHLFSFMDGKADLFPFKEFQRYSFRKTA